MTTEACSHCQTPVSVDTAACPKCGAKRKVIEVETGTGKLKFSYFHAIAAVVGGIAAYFVGQQINRPPVGVGTMLNSVLFGAAAAGLIARFMIPPKPVMKQKTIWVRQDF